VELGGISLKTLGRLRAKKAIGFITINTGNYRYRKFAHVEAFKLSLIGVRPKHEPHKTKPPTRRPYAAK